MPEPPVESSLDGNWRVSGTFGTTRRSIADVAHKFSDCESTDLPPCVPLTWSQRASLGGTSFLSPRNHENLNGRSTHECQACGFLFPLGAATTVTPAWMVLLGAALSSSQRTLDDYECLLCHQSNRCHDLRVPEELTLRWRRHHDLSVEMLRLESDALFMLSMNSGSYAQ